MESYRVILTDTARDDIQRIADYLMKYSLSAVTQFYDSLRAAHRRLEIFPMMGPEAREWELRQEHYRKLIVGDYVTLYRIEDDTCVIDHIFHGKQDYQGRYAK